MQVYRHMEVGTAKPSAEDRSRLAHHLVDVAEPSEQFNAGRFVLEAEQIIREITARGRTPVVSGGTAFYITSLLYGLPEAPAVDPGIRAGLRELEAAQGVEALHALLLQRDPDAAARIPSSDRYRVMRALEVMEATGRSLFSFAWPRRPRADMRFLVIGLDRPRAEVYGRIDARVAAMFDGGLVDEVKALLGMGYGPSAPGMRGIGYRQILDMRRGCETFQDVRERIARETRRYAKRQLTFFRAIAGVAWMSPEDQAGIKGRVRAFLEAGVGVST
jgi:tRNA dimethylallyltransferase